MERMLSDATIGTVQQITINNVLHGDVEMDGLKVRKVVLQNIDDAKKMMLPRESFCPFGVLLWVIKCEHQHIAAVQHFRQP